MVNLARTGWESTTLGGTLMLASQSWDQPGCNTQAGHGKSERTPDSFPEGSSFSLGHLASKFRGCCVLSFCTPNQPP